MMIKRIMISILGDDTQIALYNINDDDNIIIHCGSVEDVLVNIKRILTRLEEPAKNVKQV